MARGRKSTKIKVITGRDRQLFKQLSRTGICNSRQANEHCRVNKERLNKLEKSGYIKMSQHIVRGENNLIIQLDKAGREYCREEFGTQIFSIAQKNHLQHDLKLTEVYFRLSETIQDTWKNEAELIKEYYEKYPEKEGKLITCIDARIEINGELIAIESIGNSYTGDIMQVKENVGKDLGCTRMESV